MVSISTVNEVSLYILLQLYHILRDILTKFCWFLAIAGADFVTVATDTRMSAGYNVLCREHSKTTKLTENCVITSAGMVADVETLHKNLQFTIRQYELTNKKSPSV